jgi:16S rRNA processing protein RimM
MAGPTSERAAQDWLQAGAVGRPHGLDGSFYVTRPRPELLEQGAVLTVAGAPRPVTRRAGTADKPIVRLEGCEDRDAAEALRGEALMVPRKQAPELGPGEWWAEDLIGCRVGDGETEVGVVKGLLALPSCEALEVERPDGSELLVPLVGDAVRSVDTAAARIDIDLGFVEGR